MYSMPCLACHSQFAQSLLCSCSCLPCKCVPHYCMRLKPLLQGGVMVSSAAELVDKLRNEAKVI